MSVLRRLWTQVSPTLESIELGTASGASPPVRPGVFETRGIKAEDSPTTAETTKLEAGQQPRDPAQPERSILAKWFFNDLLFIAMLLLALAGVILRLPVTYWIILTPIFGVISIAEGWSHFSTRGERLGLVYRVTAIWGALLVSIYLMFNSGVAGVLNANSTSLAMITLLALGTFVAGVEARVWRICAVGAVLFLSVPGVGWLDQSPVLLASATVLIIAVGGLIWWVSQTQSRPAIDRAAGGPAAADDKQMK